MQIFVKLIGFSGPTTELDAVSSFSEIVPDTVIFDDFERYIYVFVYNYIYNFCSFLSHKEVEFEILMILLSSLF